MKDKAGRHIFVKTVQLHRPHVKGNLLKDVSKRNSRQLDYVETTGLLSYISTRNFTPFHGFNPFQKYSPTVNSGDLPGKSLLQDISLFRNFLKFLEQMLLRYFKRCKIKFA